MSNLTQYQKERINQKKGWFKSHGTSYLKDLPYPIDQAKALKGCEYVLGHPNLYKIKENNPFNLALRKRDSALLAIAWLFGKRLGEMSSLTMKDIDFEGEGINRKLSVAFKLEKKTKHQKICPSCKKKLGIDSIFCKFCSTKLSDNDLKTLKPPSPTKSIKRKRVLSKNAYQFIPFLSDWLEYRRSLGAFGYLFPPLRVLKNQNYHFDIRSKMANCTIWWIFQKLVYCPHLFRYAKTRWLLKETGGNTRRVQRMGDWATPAPIENYARSLGVTDDDIALEEL